MNRALFLDRDGVINVEKDYLYKIEDFEFCDGIFDTLQYFQGLGYLLIIITNQSGIGRGYYSKADFQNLTRWMLQQFFQKGINISKVYYSPYHPVDGIAEYKKDSFCRKPNPGMIFKAQQEWDIDLSSSILIGDNETDITAGINAGVKFNILINNSHFSITTKADLVVKSIKELINTPLLFET